MLHVNEVRHCFDLSQANLDTLQKAVAKIKDLAQKKSDGKADEATAANNSTPNLSPTGGTATKDELRTGRYTASMGRYRVTPTLSSVQCGLVQFAQELLQGIILPLHCP